MKVRAFNHSNGLLVVHIKLCVPCLLMDINYDIIHRNQTTNIHMSFACWTNDHCVFCVRMCTPISESERSSDFHSTNWNVIC